MECTRVAALLHEYADGCLTPGEAADVAAHLRACGACAARLREIEAYRRTMRSLSAAPPPDLLARVRARVARPGRLSRIPPAVVQWGCVAAVLLLLFDIASYRAIFSDLRTVRRSIGEPQPRGARPERGAESVLVLAIPSEPETATRGTGERPPADTDGSYRRSVDDLRELVTASGGIVENVVLDPARAEPVSLTVSLAPPEFEPFLRKTRAVGEMREPPPGPPRPDRDGRVRLRIELVRR